MPPQPMMPTLVLAILTPFQQGLHAGKVGFIVFAAGVAGLGDALFDIGDALLGGWVGRQQQFQRAAFSSLFQGVELFEESQ